MNTTKNTAGQITVKASELKQGDLIHVGEDEATRQKASDYMGLMTPVLKAYFTDMGLKIGKWMGEFVRDLRSNLKIAVELLES